MSNQSRVPEGVRAGGQFAASTKAESDVALNMPSPAVKTPPCPKCGTALTAAYEDHDSEGFWECWSCGTDFSNQQVVAHVPETPAWFVMPEKSEQTDEPLYEMSLQTENRVAREAARLVNDGQLIVDAPYQRPSVWTQTQRQNLVKSWLRGIPVPPITVNDRSKAGSRFGQNHPDLYRELNTTGHGTYACIDGRQRLETATAWFNGEFGVPASWFPADEVDTTIDTPDGPYVTYNGLSRSGQTSMAFTAKLPWCVGSLNSVEEEADLYVLLNTGGTDQSEEDIANAASYGSKD